MPSFRVGAVEALLEERAGLQRVEVDLPNKDGRIANGVGYDTPASTIAILDAMASEGYAVKGPPSSGNALIEELQKGDKSLMPERILADLRDVHEVFRRIEA